MATDASKACCETPAAVSEGYTTKGSYQTIADTKCYIAGSTTAKKAIYFVYDIFGFTEQTLQGADILASGGKEEYLVIIPDFFDGNPMQAEWMLQDTEDNKQKIATFRASVKEISPFLERLHKVLGAAKKEFNSVERWGTIGYCWGGKLVPLTSGTDTPWAVGVITSPSRMDPEDATKITIPFATLASKGEDADTVQAFDKGLKGPKLTITFDSQVHGWMSARADLKDPKVKEEYERGYQVALDFFAAYL